ncbi:uncharacterized protein LOC144438783 [Glandiceps talaboti]
MSSYPPHVSGPQSQDVQAISIVPIAITSAMCQQQPYTQVRCPEPMKTLGGLTSFTQGNVPELPKVTVVCKKEEKQYPRKKVKRCHVHNCEQTTDRYKSDPWMCKYHKNKAYKEAHKRRKELKQQQEKQQQKAMVIGDMNSNASRDSSASASSASPMETECQHKCNRSSSSDFMKYQPHISMLEQVLNEKKLALMRSPQVLEFIRQYQKKKEPKSVSRTRTSLDDQN